MPSVEPTLKAAIVRSAVVVAAFVGGVVVFAPAPSRAPASLVTTLPLSPALTKPSTDCDVGAGRCRFAFDAHHAIELSLSPLPVRTASPLIVTARFDGAATNPRVTFTGASMSMPVTTLPLAPAGQGSFVARGALPVCTEALMPWTARVDVDLDGEPHSATFAFVTRRAGAGVDAGLVDAGPGAALAVTADDVVDLPGGEPVDASLRSSMGPWSLSSLRGHVVLVTFGYASCPDVCPTALQALAAGVKQLGDDELARVDGVFVSVDPARDTPAQLATYAAFFHPRFRGVTGVRADLDDAVRAFGASYEIRAAAGVDAGPDYLVDHSAFTWVVGPDGRVRARLPHAAPPDVVAATVRRVLSRSP